MAAIYKQRFKVTAQDGTTITLQPIAGNAGSGSTYAKSRDLASDVTQIVITMTARDTKYFDVLNRVFDIKVEKR